MLNMMKTIVSSAFMFLILSSLLISPCARRIDRTRGRRFKTRSLYHDIRSDKKDAQVTHKNEEGGFNSREGVLVETQPHVRIHESKYWTKRSCKGKSNDGKAAGGKAGGKSRGKASTCAPSHQPSSGPTVSVAPSHNPTSSMRPSTIPSDRPSLSPTFNPSVAPSTNPSEGPSLSPTFNPSVAPSTTPSNSPTNFPTSQPTAAPTNYPSLRPTNVLSPIPTVSDEPTTTMSPIIDKFSMALDSNSNWESTCIAFQPSSDEVDGNFNDQRLVFHYRLFLPDVTSVNETIISEMEARIHKGFSQFFLECNVVGRDNGTFSIWSIFSNPPDFIYSDKCDLLGDESLPNNSRCILVQADLKMYAYFPHARHLNTERVLEPSLVTDADQQVIQESGDYLIMAMKRGDFNDNQVVLQTQFVAFIMEEDLHGTLNGGGSNVAAAEQQMQTKQGDSKVVAGAMTMAAAAICLIAVTIISLHRRKRRSDAYLKHIDDRSIFTDADKDDADRLTYIVGDNDSFDWMNEDGHNETNTNVGDGEKNTISLDYHHDVHKCSSAYCEVCRHQQHTYPTFIASKVVPSNLDGLRCGPSIIEDSRSYSSPDTVDF